MNYSSTNSRILTWLDVQRIIKDGTLNGTAYPDFIFSVDCYSNSAEVGYSGEEQQVDQWFRELFGIAYDSTRKNITLLIGNQSYPVEFFKVADAKSAQVASYPLWADIAYLKPDNNFELPKMWEDGPKVVAFHSFKGGVGRTTSMMSYVAASLDAVKDRPVRLLLIDADFEAPGISFWLDPANRPKVSFAQLLEALHYPPVDVDTTLDFFASELRKTSLDAGSASKELFILPSALDLSNMMDMPVRPEHLARNPSSPWQISDHLKSLGAKLGVDCVFVDLRAGLSELSSPLLFDPRVEHFFVTTIAPQSVSGMSTVLERLNVFQSKMPNPTLAKPTVILIMLTTVLRDLPQYGEAQAKLSVAYPGQNQDVLSSGVEFLEFDFSESLMSVGTVREAIDKSRKLSSLYSDALSWSQNSLLSKESSTNESVGNNTMASQAEAEALFKLCEKVQFAEQTSSDEMLATEPLRNLGKHFSTELPNAVSVGAKGAGKTFTFLQVCRSKTWPSFLSKLEVSHTLNGTPAIFPVIWSENLGSEAINAVNNARDQFFAKSGVNSSTLGLSSTVAKIADAMKADQNWAQFWDTLICEQVGLPYQSLRELNEFLVEKGQEVVLVFDGIEDVFDDLEKSRAKEAVKGLLQLPNRLSELRNRRIGAIVFVRADYVQASIQQNVAQYLARFTPFSLEWTPESFLRLTYWLCGQAGIIRANPARAELLTITEIQSSLEDLWGKKLGRVDSKEARSAIWVFGALSDLKGRFQARDLVRFLRVAADNQRSRTKVWKDRVLSPEAMRQAILKCSEEKVQEAIKEISVLGAWVLKLNRLSQNDRKVPFDPTKLELDPKELEALKDLGIIYDDTDQKETVERFYLPEIYRHGLKFETSVYGKPRTLALLKRNLKKLPF